MDGVICYAVIKRQLLFLYQHPLENSQEAERKELILFMHFHYRLVALILERSTRDYEITRLLWRVSAVSTE